MTAIRTILLGGALAAGSALLAHFTWIGPIVEPIRKGERASLQIGDGHEFPLSESAINAAGLKAFAVAPSGKRDEIEMAKSGNTLSAEYPVEEDGVYRFAFVQDRGVMSRTTRGLQPGGRDKNPDASSATKIFRSAVAYAATSGARPGSVKPVGIPFEITANFENGAVVATVWKDGRPWAGAGMEVVWPGKKEQSIGKTGADGKFRYAVPAGAKGPFLLLTAVSEPMPPGSNYDKATYSAALHLNWQ